MRQKEERAALAAQGSARYLLFFILSFSCIDLAFSKVVIHQIAKSDTPIYKEASFDSKVMIRVKRGQKLYGLDKTVEGKDGFGLFYKVKLKKGIYGYVLDTDLVGFKPDGVFSQKESKNALGTRRKKRDSTKWDRSSIVYSKSLGLSYSYLNYTLQTRNSKEKAGTSFFGAKLTGPWLYKNLPLDINLLMSPSSPSLFDDITTKHSGFIGFLDVSILFELFKDTDWSVYGGLGGALSYYSFELDFNGTNETSKSTQTDFGFSGVLGFGYKINRFTVKLEGKYFNTNQSQTAALLSVQSFF